MDNQLKRINPPGIDSEKPKRIAAEQIIRVARAPRLIAMVLAAIALLLVATPVGSKIVALLNFDKKIESNVDQMISEGRQTFRFDTFGDEAFWGGLLQLHQAIEGSQFGGVGPGLSVRT